LSKIAWKEIENGAPDLFSFIQSFSFRIDDYNDLMRFYARHRRFDVKMDLESYVAAICSFAGVRNPCPNWRANGCIMRSLIGNV